MSAPPRNPRGGGPSRGRAGPSTGSRIRSRGAASGRGGRGRGVGSSSTNTKAENLLQGMQSGNLNQHSGASLRGSGRATTRPNRNTTRGQNGSSTPFSSPKPTPPSSQRDYMNHMTTKFQYLKTKREAERAKAIKDGFLADPEKKTSLDKAITPAGTCTEMCPEFERVERIVQNMVDKTEKVDSNRFMLYEGMLRWRQIPDDETGREVPSEARMIKRFRRSAAGYDEQLPSDIRTPETLRATLDHLLDNVVGGEEGLAAVHKFVWDRTRGIRNDFSIQQFTKEKDVRIAVDCFERIARFHILSLHQLSNHENLVGEHFDAHQEREQLNNTLLSLMYYYDDHRGRQTFDNEAEFRSYCIIFELQSQQPDLEDRMQSWPQELLQSPPITTAFKLYSAAGNTLYDQGPLKPQAAFDVAQGNAVRFWNLLKSTDVTYLMACVAEIYFGQVRFMALQGLWKSIKRAPASMQARLQDWTVGELTRLLGFDDEEQSVEFCQEYNLGFKSNDAGEQYLDFTSQPESTLDKSCTPNKQVFSFDIVEAKRYHRTLVAVTNGIGVAQAIREGLVMAQEEKEDDETEDDTDANDENSMFFPETKVDNSKSDQHNPFGIFNPQATPFKPASITQSIFSQATSSGKTSTDVNHNAAMAPSSLPGIASNVPSTRLFGNTTSFKEPFGLQSTTPQAGSSIYTPAAATPFAPGSSFGMPSLAFNAPASPVRPNTASEVNNAWPPLVVNGITDLNKPGDEPELVPAHELDTKPLKDLFPVPLADKTNISSTKTNSEAPSLEKPPSSPRPGFRSLPSTNSAEPTNTLFPELSHSTAEPRMAAQTKTSNEAPKASPTTPRTSNSTRELFPPSVTQPSASASSSADQSKNTDSSKDGASFNNQSSLLPLKVQSTKPLFPPKSTSIPPITTSKSAIPPTLTPNISPSFASPASTKPKHKSPLGSQPPIFATDSHAKTSSPPQSAAVLSKAAHNLATVAFLEPHGILQQYVEHIAAAQIEDALRQFEREEPLRLAQFARHHLLSKKYFARWKSIYWRRKLNRNATNRRELLAQSIRRESQRKARGDAELEAILEAQKQKEKIQAEQLRRTREESHSPVQASASFKEPSKATIAGHKRKSLHGDELRPAVNGNGPRKVAKSHTHRRSKTMGGVSVVSKPSSSSTVTAAPSARRLSSSVLSGRSILLDRNNGSVFQRSTVGRKMDSTHTDYFRLKALGIDPETPIFPDTKSSLERKRHRQEELSQLTPRKRAVTSSVKARSFSRDEASSAISSQAARNVTAPGTSLPSSQQTQSGPAHSPLEDDDEFLRQIREVRAAMSADAEWFKTQAAELEKEVEKQEERRRSASQRSSTNSTGNAASESIRGLARVNGYEYAPIMPRSGSQLSLSRTEQRIRATGAHGLATKNVVDYLPVAMSKSTRSAMIGDKEPSQSTKREGKTKQVEKDSKNVYKSDEYDEEEVVSSDEGLSKRRYQRRLNHKRRIISSIRQPQSHDEGGFRSEIELGTDSPHQSNTSHHHTSVFDDDLYDEEGEEEVVAQDREYGYGSYNGLDDGEEGEDEAEYDEVDEYEENEHHSEPGSDTSTDPKGGQGSTPSTNEMAGWASPSRKANPFHMNLRSATPEAHTSPGQDHTPGGTHMSRATSGTGVSLDDALVLSD